ncbi:hypothetical protein GK047_14180 [Paenibacillus sp. SYP-B3998]|uniref:Oligosaccharide flippase family protein n=1 Tax=Paenibacillus sp. SYP-B3998 TaxID=2678564 RepID=A0A6G3ZYD8_9BACL|nr:hypothetical protein [Paenibacillus sp. SYP-B3998]NEW07152.1 hypothetical protein [Paenibacillus sp. SYP-B3998]
MVKRSILINFGVKGISIFINFLLVRVTYDFLKDKETYGVWLTILSVLSYISLFDMGLGNGLRNKLAEKISLKQFDHGKMYVSTAYGVLGIIVGVLILIFLAANQFLHWNDIFNITSDKVKLDTPITIILVSYLFIFFFSLINSVSFANQDSSIPGIITLITNLLIVISIYVCHLMGSSSIFTLSIIFSEVTLLVLICANIYLFSYKYKDIVPKRTLVKRAVIGDILNVGVKFFLIQIMSMVIFMSSSMVILQSLGANYVTEYQIVYKYFSVFIIASSLIMTPLWSAYTDAYVRKDFVWIRNTIRKLVKLMIPLTICIFGSIFFADFVIKIWMGESFNISLSLYLLMAVYTMIYIWISIFAYLLNGTNKPNIQLITLLIGGIINIPISLYFAKTLGLGNSGIVLGSICALSLFALAGPIQVYYEFYNKKRTQEGPITSLEGAE